jgi:hypothetical protein
MSESIQHLWTEEHRQKQSESHTVHEYPSPDDWFSDVGGIRSQFETLLREQGAKVAYVSSFPDIPITTVNTWFYRIGYRFQNLQKFVDYRSNLEIEIEDWLKSLGIKCFHASAGSVISGKELDLYLPDYKIAIELNGFLYHTSVEQLTQDGRKFSGGPQYRYLHRIKVDLCLERGILPFQFWIDGDQGSDPLFIDQLKSFILFQLGLSSDTECPLLESPFAPILIEDGFRYLNRDLYPQSPSSSEGISLVEGSYTHPRFGLCYNSGFWKCPVSRG